jgi:hypothetical protein
MTAVNSSSVPYSVGSEPWPCVPPVCFPTHDLAARVHDGRAQAKHAEQHVEVLSVCVCVLLLFTKKTQGKCWARV